MGALDTQPHQAGVIAVIDDDPAVRNSLKFSLEVEGFRVRLYATAEELLSDANLNDLSCVVVDQVMPAMSGLDLVVRLRRHAVSVPAVLITSRPSAVLRARAEDAGVPIVEKPLLGNALVDKIRAMAAGRA